MSDRDRLNAVLTKMKEGAALSQPDGTEVGQILIGLLKAIDETMLPRDLHISGGGHDMIFQVAKRRLHAIQGAITADLSEVDAETLEKLGVEIAEVFEGSEVSVTAARPANPVDPSALGASVAALAQAWASAGSAPATLDDFLEAAETAVVWDADEETLRKGDADDFATDLDRAALRSLSAASEGAIAATDGQGGVASVFAWSGTRQAVFLADASAVGKILRACKG